MTDSEYSAAIHDVCQTGATISAIKCFVESIRKDEREACIMAVESVQNATQGSKAECAAAIRMRPN